MKNNTLYVSLLCLGLLMSGCGGGEETPAASTPTDAAPTAGTVSASSITSSALTLTWTAGSDTVTATADLEYKVVYSTSNNISTAATAEANGTLVSNYSVNSLTANVTGLTHSTTYYFAVLVRDGASNVSVATTSATTLCSGKRIFLATVPNGNLGGASGADTYCDAQKPAAGTWKAMLYDSTNRRPCGGGDCRSSSAGAIDWVITNGQTYCKSDYSAKVGTGSYGILLVSTAGVLSSSTTTTLTGFSIYMTQAGSHCSSFTSTSGSSTMGNAASTSDGGSNNDFLVKNSAAPYFHSCNSAATIYCVEQ